MDEKDIEKQLKTHASMIAQLTQSIENQRFNSQNSIGHLIDITKGQTTIQKKILGRLEMAEQTLKDHTTRISKLEQKIK